MTTATFPLPSRHLTGQVSDVLERIRSAPVPRWGTSAADHGTYLAYLVVSSVVWIALPLLTIAAVGALLSLSL